MCEGRCVRDGVWRDGVWRDGVWRWCGVVGWYVVGRGR